MPALMMIPCPHCKKQLKGPVELQGKRVRCKACNKIFTVQGKLQPEVPAAKHQPEASATASGPSNKPAGAARPEKEAKGVVGEEQMYKISEIIRGVPRCPQCAAEMESEEAIICLDCGYNQLTGVRLNVLKTYHTTSMELMSWRLPGVLCAALTLSMLGLVCYLWLGLDAYDNEGRKSGLVFAAQIWGSVIAAFVGWASGKFALRRLITHRSPPEKLKY